MTENSEKILEMQKKALKRLGFTPEEIQEIIENDTEENDWI